MLIAVCMRQMMERLRLQKPKKISVELTKKIVKKTAEERALEVYAIISCQYASYTRYCYHFNRLTGCKGSKSGRS